MESIKELTAKLEAAKNQEKEALENAKYPTGLIIDLRKPEGNAHAIIGQCRHLGQQLGLSKAEIDDFTEQAYGGNFENLKRTCQDWFGLIFVS